MNNDYRTTFDRNNVNDNNFDAVESTTPQPPIIHTPVTTSYNLFKIAYDAHLDLADIYDETRYDDLFDGPTAAYIDEMLVNMTRIFDAERYDDLFAETIDPVDDNHLIVFADTETGRVRVFNSLDAQCERETSTEIMFASHVDDFADDMHQFIEFRSYMLYIHTA